MINVHFIYELVTFKKRSGNIFRIFIYLTARIVLLIQISC